MVICKLIWIFKLYIKFFISNKELKLKRAKKNLCFFEIIINIHFLFSRTNYKFKMFLYIKPLNFFYMHLF